MNPNMLYTLTYRKTESEMDRISPVGDKTDYILISPNGRWKLYVDSTDDTPKIKYTKGSTTYQRAVAPAGHSNKLEVYYSFGWNDKVIIMRTELRFISSDGSIHSINTNIPATKIYKNAKFYFA